MIEKVKSSFIYKFYIKYKQNKIVKNYFRKNNVKNALLCYRTTPFISSKNSYSHTNYQENYSIAKVLNKLNFNCDVINAECDKKINYDKYDLIIGFDKSFNNSFNTTKKIKRVYYGTGKHPYFSNKKTIQRGVDFYKKHNLFIKESLRLVNEDYLLQTTLCDQLIIIGDEYTLDTYRKYTDNPIEKINVSYIKTIDNTEDIIEKKDFSKVGKNFLFYSGSGMIHKGLDLLIDFFSERKDLTLNICCSMKSEKDFLKIYKNKLNNINIKYHGFISMESVTFNKMMRENTFVILPSCSEAMPTSIINCVANGGLIPILSKEASIDLDSDCVIIQSMDQKGILDSINKVLDINKNDMKNKSKNIFKKVLNKCKLSNFEETIERIIKNIK